MKHPTYISETGEKLARIVVKEIQRKDREGKEYKLYEIKISGDTEDEVICTLESLRKKLKKIK